MTLGILRTLCQLAAPELKWNWVEHNSTPILVQPTDIHACNIPSALCAVPPEDEQVMLKTCRGP
jgi:hypothetical protein